MKRVLIALLSWLSAAPLLAATPFDGLDAARRPQLKTIYSTYHDLSQFVERDSRGVVLVFLGTKCPVVRQYLPRLSELNREFRPQGFQFLGVYSGAGMNAFKMATDAHDGDVPFIILQDVDHKLADLLEASTSPEVVVLNQKLERKYQGAIDNQYSRHGQREQATQHYLRVALQSLIDDKPIEQSRVPVSGCPLERRAPQRKPHRVTFHKDIAPLVQKNCQPCHRTGGVAPFELLSYDDVAYNAEKIREVVTDRRMPPWHGVLHPEFGTLLNDKRLSEDDIAALADWIDAGAPEGDKSQAPPPIKWPKPDEWTIGKPDFIYRIPQPFRVPKSGTLEYQFFRVKIDRPEDRWFRAVEIKPGNSEVVHHISLHLAPSQDDKKLGGLAAMIQLYGLNGERASVINDYVPGDTYNAKTYPPEQAVLIPKHHDLIFEVHYTPNNRAATTDQSMVGFCWAEGPPKEQIHTSVFRVPVGGFRIPPYDPHFRMEDTYFFQHDVDIDAIRPHFHIRGKSFRLEIIKRNPDTDEIEERKTILSVPIFDQAWQRTYELAQPLRLPAGTELLATAHYDNSPINPKNPDPSAEVRWGQQTLTDEMFSTRFKYRLVKDVASV